MAGLLFSHPDARDSLVLLSPTIIAQFPAPSTRGVTLRRTSFCGRGKDAMPFGFKAGCLSQPFLLTGVTFTLMANSARTIKISVATNCWTGHRCGGAPHGKKVLGKIYAFVSPGLRRYRMARVKINQKSLLLISNNKVILYLIIKRRD